MSDEEKAVIFDLDGVLVDSYWAHFESWQRLAKEGDISFSEKTFASTFGRTSREIIAARFRSQKELSDDEIEELDQRKDHHYRDVLRKNFPAMEGAKVLIHDLHEAGFRLALGSSAPPENIALCLEKLDVRNLFEAIISGKDVSEGKPDPEVFHLVAERLGMSPESCAVIEDAPAGIEAAVAAGMSAIALAGTGRHAFIFGHADLVLTSLRQLTPDFICDIIDRHLHPETEEFE